MLYVFDDDLLCFLQVMCRQNDLRWFMVSDHEFLDLEDPCNSALRGVPAREMITNLVYGMEVSIDLRVLSLRIIIRNVV